MGNWDKARSQMGKGGGESISALNFSLLDEKHDFYKIKIGGQKLDILPFEIGKKHPYVVKGALDKGDLFYSLPIYVHRNMGPGNRSVICPNKNFGNPCPVCERAEEMQATARTEDEKKSIPWPSLRLFYNVVDKDDLDKGVQIFETNAKDFEKPLKAAQDDADKEANKDGEPTRFFADLEDGLTVKIIGAEETFNGKKYNKCSSVTLIPRKGSVEKFADDAIQFDKLIEEPTYDEIVALMSGATSDDDDEDEPAPVKRSVKKVEEDEEEERPPKRNVSRDDDDEDEKPTPKKAKDDEEGCPYGHKFGKDNGETEDCDSCQKSVWKACLKSN